MTTTFFLDSSSAVNHYDTPSSGGDSFYTSSASFYLNTIFGFLSCASCFLTILIIGKSKTYLKSKYHKIIIMDCCYGFIFSLPHIIPSAYIPKDNVYQHAKPPGITEGSITSCEAQAYLILFGMIGLLYSRFVLVLNSFFSGRKGLSNIVIFYLPILLASGLPSFFLYYKLLNPTPYDSTCFIGPYPYECFKENIDCIRGDTGRINTDQLENVLQISSSLALSILIGVVLLSIMMTIEIKKFSQGNRRNFFSEHTSMEGREPQRNENDEEQEGNIFISDFDSSQSEPPVAFTYSLSFLISWIATLIVYIEGKESASQPMKYLSTIFQNLQSFQTMIIFLFFEMWLVRHSRNADLIKWQEALKIVILGRHHEAGVRKSERTSVSNDFEQRSASDLSIVQSKAPPRPNSSKTDTTFSLRPSKASTCCSNSSKSKYDQASVIFQKNFKFYELPVLPPDHKGDEEFPSLACLQPIFEFPVDQFELCHPPQLPQVEEEP